MCLLHPIFETCNRTLRCYKVLDTSHEPKSPCYNKIYHFGTLYTESVSDIREGILMGSATIKICTGFHSYTSLKPVRELLGKSSEYKVFLAKIPKGAATIKGINDEIVSSQIIITHYYYVPVKMLGKTLFYIKKKYREIGHK